MIRGVIFDYGSTLIRFDGDVKEVRIQAHRALALAMRAEGMEFKESSFLGRFARKIDEYDRRRGVDNLETTTAVVLADALREEGLPVQPADRIRRVLREMYRVYERHWKLFPETHAALKQIRTQRFRLALLSNASDEINVRQMLKDHSLEKYFRPVVISAAIGVRKPDPRAFRPILDAWGFPPDQVVMVGDQLGMDILGARQLGMRTIWLRTEENSPANKAYQGKVCPDAQVKTIGEVAAILMHWKERKRK